MQNLKKFYTFFVTAFLLCSYSSSFAQSTNKFFGMNYWEYQIYTSGVSVDKFQQNMAETSTWNCSIVRLGGNHANTSRNTDADKDWYVTAILNIKSMNLTPLVQLPINLTATQVGQWMDYFNVTKNLGIVYWGIGNEPDPSSNWDAWYTGTYFHDGRNYSGFKAQFRLIAKAIKAKDANSIICGPDYRHWWGTSTTGPFGQWYKDFIMGANAVATDTYNGDPIVDIFPFHFYGDANEATMISRYAILNPMIAAANALRPANQPLKIAVGEYNTDVTVGSETFVAGQYMAIMAKQALANGCVYFAPWSIEEGNNFRLIESDGTLRSTAQHMKMLSQNKRANYMSGQINNNFTNNIMEFGMQDANGYTVMVMNKSATDYSFSVKFSTTSGTYSAANTTLKFRFNANVNIDFSNLTLFKNSTLLFTFDAAGNMVKKMEYRSGYTAPITTNYPVVNTPPSVSITSPVANASFASGTAIAIAATATDVAPGTVSSVSFYDGTTLLGSDLTSPYSFSWTGASLGSHSITAKATDNNGAVTTSTAVSITVTNVAPSVSITSPLANASFASGTAISIAATATDVAPGTVSSVSFYDGTTLLGSDATSPYSFSWTGASVGSHSITAKATDNDGAVTTSAAVTITVAAVNTPPSVSITSPLANASFASGTAIAIAATASDVAPGTVSSVSFYDGTTLLGTDLTSPYSFSWTGASVGSHSITAKATDNDGAVTTSAAVSITVTAVNTPPSVSITSPLANASFASGTAIIIAATATDVAPGTVSSVSFYDGTTLLGSDATSPYSFSWTGASVGSHSITAKATDNDGAVTTSAAITITVAAVNTPPSVSITAPLTGTSYNSGTTINLAANASDVAPGTVISVSFYDGTTLIGTDNTSPYTFTWTGAAVGTHSITAKATDNGGAVSTSGVISITVNVVTDDIIGENCAMANETKIYTLNSINTVNATSYNWWFNGSTQSVTPVAGQPQSVTINFGQWFSGGQVCVGVAYSSGQSYKQYCKDVAVCPSLSPSAKVGLVAQIVVNSAKSLDFSVHPNPATDETWIDLNAFEGLPIELIMYDIAGKVIRTEKVQKATTTPHSLDLSGIASGTYFMTIQTSGKRTVLRKLSIMK